VFSFVNALPLLADGASVVFVGSVGRRKGSPATRFTPAARASFVRSSRNAGTSHELMARRIRVNRVARADRDAVDRECNGRRRDPQLCRGLVPMGRWDAPTKSRRNPVSRIARGPLHDRRGPHGRRRNGPCLRCFRPDTPASIVDVI